MRTLLLLRGLPGSGKSTWVKENSLTNFTISSDDIRLLYRNPEMLPDGSYSISQKDNNIVWKLLFEILEERMKRGEFTIIDATHVKTSEFNKYKQLCSTYRYRIFCVDFTDVPINEVMERNRSRSSFRVVPDHAIERMNNVIKHQQIPTGITVIKPDELSKVYLKLFDFSNYKKIHHIGDIHGCNTALQEYLSSNGGLKDDEYYIFLGDYIDRGLENADVLKFLISIKDKKNVLMLEGNHEKWLWMYSHDLKTFSKEFENNTKPQLIESGIDKKDIRQLYRRLGQCAYYSYNGNIYFVSHGGISTMPDNLTSLSTDQMIHGVGKYSDFEKVAKTWNETTPDNYYQIFGHRNTTQLPIMLTDRVCDLEGRIEFGGCLRAVQLDSDGLRPIEIKNNVFKIPEDNIEIIDNNSSISDMIKSLRNNECIKEKPFGNISSFNFTRNAFYDKVWDKQTTRARGLFIDTIKEKIVARSYDKFFNINEMPETRLKTLQKNMKFPVTAYVKENGFLGIVGYDEYNDSLFISSKSTPTSPFSGWFKDLLYSKLSQDNLQKMKEYIKDNDVSFIFESVDMVNDPHIIEYPKSNIYLLDIVHNTIDFKKYDYETMCHVADMFGIDHKEKAFVLESWDEFHEWYYDVTKQGYEYNGRNIEGFVIEDCNGFMTKLKLQYYKFWKSMRTVSEEIVSNNGQLKHKQYLSSKLANDYYEWFINNYYSHDKPNFPRNICKLRKTFYESR